MFWGPLHLPGATRDWGRQGRVDLELGSHTGSFVCPWAASKGWLPEGASACAWWQQRRAQRCRRRRLCDGDVSGREECRTAMAFCPRGGRWRRGTATGGESSEGTSVGAQWASGVRGVPVDGPLQLPLRNASCRWCPPCSGAVTPGTRRMRGRPGGERGATERGRFGEGGL